MRIVRIIICMEVQLAMITQAHSATTRPKNTRALAGALPPLASAELLGGRGEVEILHQGEIYRLRRTRQGKLILTK